MHTIAAPGNLDRVCLMNGQMRMVEDHFVSKSLALRIRLVNISLGR